MELGSATHVPDPNLLVVPSCPPLISRPLGKLGSRVKPGRNTVTTSPVPIPPHVKQLTNEILMSEGFPATMPEYSIAKLPS
eukprot:2391769-Rhodomonas_salina.1